MITQEDQLQLFELIAKKISFDIDAYVFGGTAMMFYGYKDETKDIDILFETEKQRNEFIKIIKDLGFGTYSPMNLYIPKKLQDKNNPLMFQRLDYRIDVFVKRIFRTQLSDKMKEDAFALHEFRGKNTLGIHVLRKEHIVQLKAITERQNDFDDIVNIVSKEKNFNWQYVIDEVVWQHQHGDSWAIIDMEKAMHELKNEFLIEKRFFDQLYKAQNDKKKK